MWVVAGLLALSGLVDAATFSNSSIPASPSTSQNVAAVSNIESTSSSSGLASSTSCATANTDCTYWIDTSIVTFPYSTTDDFILKVSATEVPITYKYSDGRIARIVTSTFTNYQANISVTANAAFSTPSVNLKTWQFGPYTLTYPTTYFAIARGTVTGYPAPTAGSPLSNTCQKSEIEAEIPLPPVPESDLIAVASEKSAALAQLTSSVDKSLCRQFPLSTPTATRSIAFDTLQPPALSAPPVQYTSVQVLLQQGQGTTVTVPDGFGVGLPVANTPGNSGANPTNAGGGSQQGGSPQGGPSPGQGGNPGTQQQQAGSPITVNGATLTPISGGAAIINGQTVQPGTGTNLPNGQQVSVGQNGGVVVVNGQTATVPGPRGAGSPVTLAGSGVTPLSDGGFVVGGTTIRPGNSLTLPNGQIISIGHSGDVAVNGQTTNFQFSHGGATPVTIDGAVVTPLPGGAIVVSGERILPGHSTVLPNGQTISVAPGGTAVVVNGQTSSIAPLVAVAPVVINGATITPGPSGAVIVAGQTLSAWQIITLSNGHVLSVGTNGTVVVDGSTTKLPIIFGNSTSTSSNSTSITSTTSSSTTRSVGDAIASGIGVTKKANANTIYVAGLENQFGVGLLLGLLGFIGLL